MKGFLIRNLKVFFKDKTAVFFSLLAVFIIIGLYALFLGDVWVESFGDMRETRYLMDSWIMAGLLAVISVTTTMGAYGTMVEDKSKGVNKDFIVSPVKKHDIVMGYILSAVIIGIIMSVIAFVLAQVYIVINGGNFLNFSQTIKTLGLIILATLTNSSIVLFVVSFFNSSNAFATASTIIGTLIGFITGIYLPVGSLPNAVQWIVKCFPVSHAASLFRQVMMERPMSVTFAGASETAAAEFKEMMGVTFSFGNGEVSPYISIIILICTAALFYTLSLFNLYRSRR